MKFLVIRLSSIGDIVLTTPVIRCLKKQVATADIHFLTKSSLRMVSASNPYIDRYHYVENDLPAVIESLKAEKFDYVIDLHDNLRSNQVKRALNLKSYTVDKLVLERYLLTRLHVNRMGNNHIVKRNLATVATFGVQDDGGGLDYFIAEENRVAESDIPASHLAGYLAVVIGASYPTKKLPLHKLKQLCAAIDHPIILLGGPGDQDEGEALAATDQGKIYNACGRFNIDESADLVRRSKLVVSHDTGLQHIAAAFRKPLLALWGSTSPELQMQPYYGAGVQPGTNGSPFENIRRPGLRCQPCSRHGYKKCPLGHFKCMEEMDIDYIAQRVRERLGR